LVKEFALHSILALQRSQPIISCLLIPYFQKLVKIKRILFFADKRSINMTCYKQQTFLWFRETFADDKFIGIKEAFMLFYPTVKIMV
jgi:hypothetical protein